MIDYPGHSSFLQTGLSDRALDLPPDLPCPDKRALGRVSPYRATRTGSPRTRRSRTTMRRSTATAPPARAAPTARWGCLPRHATPRRRNSTPYPRAAAVRVAIIHIMKSPAFPAGRRQCVRISYRTIKTPSRVRELHVQLAPARDVQRTHASRRLSSLPTASTPRAGRRTRGRRRATGWTPRAATAAPPWRWAYTGTHSHPQQLRPWGTVLRDIL